MDFSNNFKGLFAWCHMLLFNDGAALCSVASAEKLKVFYVRLGMILAYNSHKDKKTGYIPINI